LPRPPGPVPPDDRRAGKAGRSRAASRPLSRAKLFLERRREITSCGLVSTPGCRPERPFSAPRPNNALPRPLPPHPPPPTPPRPVNPDPRRRGKVPRFGRRIPDGGRYSVDNYLYFAGRCSRFTEKVRKGRAGIPAWGSVGAVGTPPRVAGDYLPFLVL